MTSGSSRASDRPGHRPLNHRTCRSCKNEDGQPHFHDPSRTTLCGPQTMLVSFPIPKKSCRVGDVSPVSLDEHGRLPGRHGGAHLEQIVVEIVLHVMKKVVCVAKVTRFLKEFSAWCVCPNRLAIETKRKRVFSRPKRGSGARL